MRFAASPLMVAVALGLLGPSVLDVEEDGIEDGMEDVARNDSTPGDDVEAVQSLLQELRAEAE